MFVRPVISIESSLTSFARHRVPLYAVSSLIALFSLDAAFFIDAIRDLYEVCARSIHGDQRQLTQV